MNLGVTEQPSYLKNIDIPGDKIAFNDFTLRFIVDENLRTTCKFISGFEDLGYPDSLNDIFDLQVEDDQYYRL